MLLAPLPCRCRAVSGAGGRVFAPLRSVADVLIPAEGGPLNGKKIPWRRKLLIVEHCQNDECSHHVYLTDKTNAQKFVWLGQAQAVRSVIEPIKRLEVCFTMVP